jgi:hypothetical protein
MAYIGNNLTVQQYAPQVAYFNGNGSQTAFTLPVAVVSAAQIIVAIDNVIQNPSSAFTVSGSTITFTSAPLSGTNNIWVEYTSLQTNLVQPANGTVNTAQLGTITNISSGNSALTLQTGSTPTTAVTIDTSRNVGIGTTSPASGLEIYRAVSTTGSLTDASLMLSTTATTGRKVSIGFGLGGGVANTCAANIGYDVISGTGAGYGDIYFSTRSTTADSSPTERMRIDSSGRLMVGTTTQYARITADAGNDECIFAINSSGAASATMVSWNNAGTGNNYLHAFFVDAGGSNVGNIDYNRAAGLVRYNVTSDATLKNIIGDSNGQRSLEILNTTRIRDFAWKNDTEQKTQIGVIAQELYETYKGAVSVGGENDKGEYRPWGVDKTAFTFHLIAGWQAHEKLIKELNAKVIALEAKLEAK